MNDPASAWSVQEAPGLPWSLVNAPTGDLPDINVWLALAVQEHPHHALARQYWDSVLAQTPVATSPCLWFCRTTALGLVRLLCQPKAVGPGALSLSDAWRLYQSYRSLPQIGLVGDPTNCDTHIDALLTSAQPGARLWTDTYLAALAQCSGLRLVTFDRDFERFGLTNFLRLQTAP